MLRKLLLIIMLITIMPVLSSAQTRKGSESENQKPINDYKLNVKYNTNIFHKYSFTENSKITREFSDGSSLNLSRNVIYYISIMQNTLPQDGFNTVKVMIDSLVYEFFEDGKLKFHHDSQDDESDAPFNHLDFLYYVIPLGMEFEITYSPYNDVARISGELLNRIRNRNNDEEEGIQDQKLRYIWNRSLGDNYLVFIANLLKNFIPEQRVEKDSLYNTPFEIFVDGVRYLDTAEVKLIEFSPRDYKISATFDNLNATDDFFTTYSIDELIEVNEGKGEGTALLTVSPQGQIRQLEIDVNTWFTSNLRKEVFKQKSQTKFIWKLEGMFR